MAELRREVELLKKEIGSLRTEVQKTTGPAVAADKAAGSEPAVIRAEAAGRVKFEVERALPRSLQVPGHSRSSNLPAKRGQTKS